MKKSITVIFLVLFVAMNNPFSVMAQVMFQNEYSPVMAGSFVIAPLEDGYLVAGSAETSTAGGIDGFVMKINFAGACLWSRVYGGTKDDRFFSIYKTHNGNYVLSGITTSFVNSSADPSNIYLVEIDTSGSVIWSKSLGTLNTDIAYSVKETSDHGLIIAGTTDSAGYISAYLIKTDSLVNIQWSHIYSNPAYDVIIARAVVQTSDGGYAFTGYSTLSTAAVDTNMFIVKTDSNGVINLSTHYFFTDSAHYTQRCAYGYDIIQNAAGHLVIVGGVGGYYFSPGFYPYSPLLMETDINGTVFNSKSFFLNSGDCRSFSVQQTTDGGYILGGFMGNVFLSMIKTDSAITTQWCYHYDESYNPMSIGYCARLTSDGGFILSGCLWLGTSIRIVKTNSEGISGCEQAVPIGGGGISGNISLASLISPWSYINNADTVTASTISNNISVSTDVICSNVGVDDLTNTELLNIYPIPAKDNITIEISANRTQSQLTILNLNGKEILTRQITESKTLIDISTLPSGVYVVKVVGEKGVQVGKFIKQ